MYIIYVDSNSMPPRIAKKPAVPEPVDEAEKLKTQLRDALLEANESGKMNQVLEAHLGSMDAEEVWMGGRLYGGRKIVTSGSITVRI